MLGLSDDPSRVPPASPRPDACWAGPGAARGRGQAVGRALRRSGAPVTARARRHGGARSRWKQRPDWQAPGLSSRRRSTTGGCARRATRRSSRARRGSRSPATRWTEADLRTADAMTGIEAAEAPGAAAAPRGAAAQSVRLHGGDRLHVAAERASAARASTTRRGGRRGC